MQVLDQSQKDLMYVKRKRHMLDFSNLATILNLTKESVFDAQIGKAVTDDTYRRVTDWLK